MLYSVNNTWLSHNVMMSLIEHIDKFVECDSDKDIIDILAQLIPATKEHKVDKYTTEIVSRFTRVLPIGSYIVVSDVTRAAYEIANRVIKETSYSPASASMPALDVCNKLRPTNSEYISGRDKELSIILSCLSRSRKRGIILVGDAGTGKTAIAEALAYKLASGQCPKDMLGCSVYNMDIPSIVSKHKDDAVNIIIKILESANVNDNIILFIDEVHQVLGAKLGDLMKPYLTGSMRFIGSTTMDEYYEYIAADPALERRFQIIRVDEPTLEQTIDMMLTSKEILEKKHSCSIDSEICRYAVLQGGRFLGHRRNPDKSVDILDTACALLRQRLPTKVKQVKDCKSIFNIKTFHDNLTKENAVIRILSKSDIDQAIGLLGNLDPSFVTVASDENKITEMLDMKVFGQHDVNTKLAEIPNILCRLTTKRVRPPAVLLFAGPRGCGKREAAKSLAEICFGNRDLFIELDMSSMTEDFMITELKGAPPGYVGYNKSGTLVRKLREKQQCVLYISSIDKASSTVLTYLLHAIKNYTIKDASNKEVSLLNVIIIFSVSCNWEDSRSMGFMKSEVRKELTFGELVTKDIKPVADNILEFKELTKESLGLIFDREVKIYTDMYNVSPDLSRIREKCLETAKNGHDVTLFVTSDVLKLILESLKGDDMTSIPSSIRNMLLNQHRNGATSEEAARYVNKTETAKKRGVRLTKQQVAGYFANFSRCY